MPNRLLLAAFCALALPWPSAAATAPQVVDPAGDANGLDARYLGAPTPGDVGTPAGSQPAFDLTAVHWYADSSAVLAAVHLTAPPDPGRTGRYVVTFATPACASAQLLWVSSWTSAVVQGCRPNHFLSLAAPAWNGRALVFRLPRAALPKWLAAGTVITDIGARTAPWVELTAGAAYPTADYARGGTPYRLGD